MAAQVISLAQRMRAPAFRDWSRQELAEFYRVESALLQAGLELETERGLSDEGDPWFVFCRADTGEVFIHFARSDGWYVVDGAALGAPSRGRDFGALVRDLIGRHPLAATRRPGSNVLMHPAALLIALVGAAFFHSGRAKAAEVAHHDAPAAGGDAREGRRGLLLNVGSAPAAATGEGSRTVALDASQVAAVLTGVAIGLRALADAPAAVAAPASDGLADLPAVAAAPGLRDLAGRGDRSASADMLGALSASDTRAALTVMAVIHDLARTATAAAAAPVAATTPATVDLPVRMGGGGPPAGGGPPTGGGPPGVTFLVHLAAGPLPQIEALAVVSADGALARISPDRVVHVDQLPSFLADLINHGDIGGPGSGSSSGVDAAPSPSSTTSDATGTVDHSTVQAVASGDLPHLGASRGSANEHASTTAPASPSTPAPVTLAPASITIVQPSTDHPVAAPAHPVYIDNAVLAFVTAVTDVQVVIAGHDVVFYDPAILTALAPGETLDSVTWRLEDGSSVSLVGTASELHNDHGLG